MQHQSSDYGFPHYAGGASQKHYPAAHSTSSAFSASASPNEDWTKISDLAERRRIQNRIAQRNYRKKLKKRLDDLERRASSSSESPEQTYEELSPPQATTPRTQGSKSSRTPLEQVPVIPAEECIIPSEDRAMFSQQSTRQLSTSPPPFSCLPMDSTESASYSEFQITPSSCNPSSNGADLSFYLPQYTPGFMSACGMHNMNTLSVKQEFYGDDEMNPFSMSYASINDMPSYSEIPPYVSREHQASFARPSKFPTLSG